jgi:aminoglycoside phosphotransferase (APT) family kinase protein
LNHPFTDLAVTRSFLKTVLESDAISQLEWLEKGMNNQALAFFYEGQPQILRISRERESVWNDNAAAHHLWDRLPIPFAAWEGEIGPYFWVIQPQCPGRAMAVMPIAEQRALIGSVVQTLLNLHGAALKWPPPPLDWQATQLIQGLGTASTKLSQHTLLKPAVFERLYQELLSYLPFCPVPAWMIHGDFKPEHLFFNQGQLTGIIDWSAFGIGDFVYDAAVLLFYLPPELEPEFRLALQQNYQRYGLPLENWRERLLAYQLRTALWSLITFSRFQQTERFAQQWLRTQRHFGL